METDIVYMYANINNTVVVARNRRIVFRGARNTTLLNTIEEHFQLFAQTVREVLYS